MTASTKIRAVGNSKGVILPKKFLEQCGIKDEVDITVKDKVITIAASKGAGKKKWADFDRTKKKSSALVTNKFDEKDWTW